ncbi:MAG: hypothetical protein IH606_00220 [Burkholderiales bacterium]|nr:hypothetical protein [Burkholderiales bacterium]
MKPGPAIAALCTALALAGCASTSITGAGVTPSMQGSVPAPGSAYSSGVVYFDVDANAYFALLMLGLYAAGVQDDHPGSSYGPGGRLPPQMDQGRAIAERDCTQPMEAPSANLRCK